MNGLDCYDVTQNLRFLKTCQFTSVDYFKDSFKYVI